ncbi:MAG: hypothetical protein E6I02_05025 [Chloroflexi bacterium]|nr:MAG: hypothetical protein E6I02_05025 [Chloroflexota bacterium]
MTGGLAGGHGCDPIGRIIDTVVYLAPGEQTVVSATPTFDCRDVEGALGQTYTVAAAADAHADDRDAWYSISRPRPASSHSATTTTTAATTD